MFLAQCEEQGQEVLIWTSEVESIENTDHGIVVRYRCPCGDTAELVTGAAAPVRFNLHVGV